MRTLQQTIDAARRLFETSTEELTYATCAYDVLPPQLELEKDPKYLLT